MTSSLFLVSPKSIIIHGKKITKMARLNKKIKRRQISSSRLLLDPNPMPNPKSGAKPNLAAAAATTATCSRPPSRVHSSAYHDPLLLVGGGSVATVTATATASASDMATDKGTGMRGLLSWYDARSESRCMPWRKPFLKLEDSPASSSLSLGQGLGQSPASSSPSTDCNASPTERQNKRAYEIWVSEIMLQQTRVSTVIPYYTSWIQKWPTVHALAQASSDEVLSAWKGLGYYSRATRLHLAAKQIVQDFGGKIPSKVEGLLKIQGIGAYTAGAIASIAFGRAVPLLDGNVARVLSRQIGLYGRVKERKIEDKLWQVAGELVRSAAGDKDEGEVSDVPGRWNQGLMELGSTICAPRPKCEECPIQETCRAYAEGALLAKTRREDEQQQEEKIVDIEDICQLCSPLEMEEVEATIAQEEEQDDSKDLSVSKSKKRTASEGLALRPSKTRKQTTLITSFISSTRAATTTVATTPSLPTETPNHIKASASASTYCTLFPQRPIKKSIPIEEHLVCIINHQHQKETTFAVPNQAERKYLLQQRPPKGLLASLWEFPTVIYDDDQKYSNKSKNKTKKKTARRKDDEDGDGDDEEQEEKQEAEQEEKEEAEQEVDRKDPRLNKALNFVQTLLGKGWIVDVDVDANVNAGGKKEKGKIGELTHVFSHLKVQMVIYSFLVSRTRTTTPTPTPETLPQRQKWLSSTQIQESTLGTGMQKVWSLYQSQ